MSICTNVLVVQEVRLLEISSLGNNNNVGCLKCPHIRYVVF